MKRFLPFALVLCSGAWIYACSSSDDSNSGSPSDTTGEDGGGGNTDPNNPGNNNGDPDAGPGNDSSTPDASSGVNPIEGATAKAEPGLEAVGYVDGLVWKTDALYFALPDQKLIVKYTPASTATDKTMPYVTAEPALGITYDEKANTLLFASSGSTPVSAAVKRAAAGQAAAVTPTNVPLTTDAGAPFSPNDLVVRKADGTIYMTDPGYQASNILNGVYRLTPPGLAVQIAAYTEERPNGIALSPDSSTLYVSLTQNQPPPATGAKTPSIVKFTVKADGSTGDPTKFVDITPNDSLVDGLAVDTAGNVYAATKVGVQVFAADGTKWGQIATTQPATNIAFGGTDGKTLYIATMNGIQSATVKVAGLGQ